MSILALAIDELAWSAAHCASAILKQCHSAVISAWLSAALEHAKRSDLLAEYEALRTINTDRADHFLMAPATFKALSAPIISSRSPDIDFLLRALHAEAALADISNHRCLSYSGRDDPLLWTALGDYFICTADGISERTFDNVCGVFVDFGTPRSAFDFANGKPTCAYDDTTRTIIFSALEASFDYIGQIVPAKIFVTEWIRSISVQRQPTATPFLSGSRAELVGQAALANPHRASILDLADALVHESVHAFLYALEYVEPLYTTKRDRGPTVISPWTGRILSGHSYVHACFVWFALLNFWTRHPATNSPVFASPNYYLKRAALGFSSTDLGDPIRDFASPSALEAILTMQRQARSLLSC